MFWCRRFLIFCFLILIFFLLGFLCIWVCLRVKIRLRLLLICMVFWWCWIIWCSRIIFLRFLYFCCWCLWLSLIVFWNFVFLFVIVCCRCCIRFRFKVFFIFWFGLVSWGGIWMNWGVVYVIVLDRILVIGRVGLCFMCFVSFLSMCVGVVYV